MPTTEVGLLLYSSIWHPFSWKLWFTFANLFSVLILWLPLSSIWHCYTCLSTEKLSSPYFHDTSLCCSLPISLPIHLSHHHKFSFLHPAMNAKAQSSVPVSPSCHPVHYHSYSKLSFLPRPPETIKELTVGL